MKLLDLFCGAGGAAMGYSRAGFTEIVGVDLVEQPRYPFRFVRGDALQVLAWMAKADGKFPVDHPDGRREWLGPFDCVHASPPCQVFTSANARWRNKGTKADQHQDLLRPVAAQLRKQGHTYVIENVEGAVHAFQPNLRLVGHLFDLRVWRPRLFEINPDCVKQPYCGRPAGQIIGVYGDRPDGRLLNSRSSPKTGNRAAKGLAEGQHAMGMPWADWKGCTQAIPPAYTEYIGRQLLQHLRAVA